MHFSLWWRRRCLVLKTTWQRSQTYPALSPACFPSRCNLMLYVLWVKCWHSLQQSLPSSVRSACNSTRSAYREISLKSGVLFAKWTHDIIYHVPDQPRSWDQQNVRKNRPIQPNVFHFKTIWPILLMYGPSVELRTHWISIYCLNLPQLTSLKPNQLRISQEI